MALTTERYAEIDAELLQMRDYMAALAREIDAAASFPDGALHASAISALVAIIVLHHTLEQSKEHERAGEKI